MSKKAWIGAGKVSAAVAAVALVIGVSFQGQAQQRSDMADVRAELRNGFAEVNRRFSEVNARFAEVNGRLDRIESDLSTVRERVARIEGHLALPADMNPQAHSTP